MSSLDCSLVVRCVTTASACLYVMRNRVISKYLPTFREQIELFASHGILIAPHGAGLMNSVFLAPFSSVIEIFPYHTDHNLYPNVVVNSGLGYYPIHSFNGTDMMSRYKVRLRLSF